jgi:hypothetical protein
VTGVPTRRPLNQGRQPVLVPHRAVLSISSSNPFTDHQPSVRLQTPHAMTDPKEHTTSAYDYTDKSVPQAGYAAIAYGAVSLVTGLFAWLQYLLYHTRSQGGFLHREFANQQWVQHTPLVTAVTVVLSVIIAAISAVLAFGIFRRSRAAIIAMLIFVIVLQLYTWFVARSVAGTLVTIIVVGFLLRGTRRMFQDYAERELDSTKEV